MVSKNTAGGSETALWEAYADDWEDVHALDGWVVKMLYAVEQARGWAGWTVDVVRALASKVLDHVQQAHVSTVTTDRGR